MESKLIRVLYWIRCIGSGCLFIIATLWVCYGLFSGQSLFWKEVPAWMAFIIFLLLLVLLANLEGLQVSLLKVADMNPEAIALTHPTAYKQTVFISKNKNMAKFLMGRQVVVVITVFLLSRLTTFEMKTVPFTDEPLPLWLQALGESGLVGVMVVVIAAQLVPQLINEKWPVQILNNVATNWSLWVSLAFEYCGIVHAAYFFADVVMYALRNRIEEVKDIEQVKSIELVSVKIEGNTVDTLDTPEEWNKLINWDFHSFDNQQDGDEKIQGEFPLELDLSASVNLDALALYANRHPEVFHKFPVIIGRKAYASPQAVSSWLKQKGIETPKFLLPITDPEHVPPHIAACKLMGICVPHQENC